MVGSDDGWRPWLRAANPFGTIKTEAEALRAGRWGAVATGLMAAQAAAGALLINVVLGGPHREVMRQALQASNASGGLDPETSRAMADAFVAMFPPVMTGVFIVISIILAICAVATWRKPNQAVPLALLLIMALDLTMRALRLLTPGPTSAFTSPHWATAYAILSYIVLMPLLVAGFRGAGRLAELRRQAGAKPA